MTEHLLPGNSTALERATSESLDRGSLLAPAIDSMRGLKFRNPLNPSFAPWIVAEYGLGNISAYFDDAVELLEIGIAWQRKRGTPAALAAALGWIGYSATTLEDQFPNRRKWNRYQIGMGKVPAVDLPVLMDAEYLAGISDPARSVFFRGWHGYDIRALTWSGRKWGRSIWSDDSGVRVGGETKWSHGEDAVGSIVATSGERIALGVDVHNGDVLSWDDVPWNAPGIGWSGVFDAPAFKSFLLLRLPVYVGFYNSSGQPIGFRRPVAVRDVTAAHPGAGSSIFVEVECRTGFGDGEGRAAASCALVFRAHNTDTTKPGKLWLDPNELAFEAGYDGSNMTIGSVPLDFLFRRTVRQHVTLTLEI